MVKAFAHLIEGWSLIPYMGRPDANHYNMGDIIRIFQTKFCQYNEFQVLFILLHYTVTYNL